MNEQWQNHYEPLYDDGHYDGAIFAITVTAPSGTVFFKLARCAPMRNKPDQFYVNTKPLMIKAEHRDSFLAAVATYYSKVARIDTSTAVGAALNKAVKVKNGKANATA